MVPGSSALKLVQRVDLAVLGADAVLHVGGQVVKIFLSPWVVPEQHIEIGVRLVHKITPHLGCRFSSADTQVNGW